MIRIDSAEFGVQKWKDNPKAGTKRIADTFHGLGLIPRAIRVADAVRQTGA